MNQKNLSSLLGIALIIFGIIAWQKAANKSTDINYSKTNEIPSYSEENIGMADDTPAVEIKCEGGRVSALGFSIDCKYDTLFLNDNVLIMSDGHEGPWLFDIGVVKNDPRFKSIDEFIQSQEIHKEDNSNAGIKFIKYFNGSAGKFAIFFNYVVADMDTINNRAVYAPALNAVLMGKNNKTYLFSKRVEINPQENDKEFEDILLSFRED